MRKLHLLFGTHWDNLINFAQKNNGKEQAQAQQTLTMNHFFFSVKTLFSFKLNTFLHFFNVSPRGNPIR